MALSWGPFSESHRTEWVNRSGSRAMLHRCLDWEKRPACTDGRPQGCWDLTSHAPGMLGSTLVLVLVLS